MIQVEQGRRREEKKRRREEIERGAASQDEQIEMSSWKSERSPSRRKPTEEAKKRSKVSKNANSITNR
jgi:hypothetical protein